MDYKSDIIAMVQEIASKSILKKIYKFVRMLYRAERGGAD